MWKDSDLVLDAKPMHSAITDSRVNVDLTEVGLSLPRLSPDSSTAWQDMLETETAARWSLETSHYQLRLQLSHPGKLAWNLKITPLKRKIIFQTSIFVFHVNFQGCKGFDKTLASQHLVAPTSSMSALSHSARQALPGKEGFQHPHHLQWGTNYLQSAAGKSHGYLDPSFEFLGFKLSNVLPQSLAASRARLLHLRRFFHVESTVSWKPILKSESSKPKPLSLTTRMSFMSCVPFPFPPSGSLVESLLERNFWKRLVLARKGALSGSQATCNVSCMSHGQPWSTKSKKTRLIMNVNPSIPQYFLQGVLSTVSNCIFKNFDESYDDIGMNVTYHTWGSKAENPHWNWDTQWHFQPQMGGDPMRHRSCTGTILLEFWTSDVLTTPLSAASTSFPVDLQLLSTCDPFFAQGCITAATNKAFKRHMKMKPTWHNKKWHGELLQKIGTPPPPKNNKSTVLTVTCTALVIFVQPLRV